MSFYVNTEEHQRLVALFSQCGGDPVKMHKALSESPSEAEAEAGQQGGCRYRVSLTRLQQKAPTDATIFACHVIAGDYGSAGASGDEEGCEGQVQVVTKTCK
jgi:hypothetical protein